MPRSAPARRALPALARMTAATRVGRLRGVMALVAVGGTEAANRFLKEANAVFTREWPAEKPLALADLASGSVAANGEVDVVFVRGRKTVQARSPAIDGPITGTIVGR